MESLFPLCTLVMPKSISTTLVRGSLASLLKLVILSGLLLKFALLICEFKLADLIGSQPDYLISQGHKLSQLRISSAWYCVSEATT